MKEKNRTTEEVQISDDELSNANRQLALQEKKIREIEANMQALLNNTLQIFYLVDTSYKIITFNKKAADAIKNAYDRTIAPGDSVIDLIAAQNLDIFNRDFKKALNGETVNGERSIIDTNGNFYWYQYIYTPVLSESGIVTAVAMSMLDVTHSKKLVSELNTTEKLLASVFNATSIGIAIIDEPGRIVDVNQEFCHLYGYDKSELKGKDHTMLIVPEDAERAHQRHLNFMAGSEKEPGFEMKALRKNGSHFDIYTSSELLVQDDGKKYKVKSVRDITVEKKANRVIEASHVKYRAIVDNSMHAFFLTKPDGTILESNKAATTLLGYTEEEFRQMGRQGFIEETENLRNKLKERDEKGYMTGEITAIKKNGEKIICEFSSVIFNDIDGERKTSTMLTDISERKKIERLLEDTNILARVGGWEVDFTNNKLYWSPVVKLLHEVDDDFEPDIETAIDFYKEGENRNQITDAVKNGIEKGEAWNLDLQIITAKGNEKWVRARGRPEFENGKLVRLFGSVQDIHDKKMNELALLRSRQEYQSLFEQNPSGVIYLSLQGQISHANNTASTITETSLESLLKQHFADYLHPDDKTRVLSILEEVKEGASDNYTCKIISGSGNVKYLNVSSMPIVVDKAVVGIYSIIHDSTQEKLFEEELKFQSHLLNTIHQSVIVTNTDGTIIYWNKYAEDLYGWEKSEVLGRNVVDVVPADLAKEDAKIIMDQLSKGDSWSGEFMVKTKAGKSFRARVHDSPLFDKKGSLSGIIGVSWDVTKEIEAREFINFQAELLDNVEQAVFACDINGNIFFWNRFAEKLYGYPKDEALGINVQNLRFPNPTSSEATSDDISHVAKENFDKGKSWTAEFTAQNKQGHSFPVFAINSPLYDKLSHLSGFIAVSYDISEKKAAEQQKEFDRLNKEALINNTSDLIWSLDKDYRLIAANQSFIDAVKIYSGIEIHPGDSVLDENLAPVSIINRWKGNMDQGFTGKSLSFEMFVPATAENDEQWIETSINPITNNGEVIGIACYGRNITESKLFQKRLIEINEKLETAQRTAQLGYWERHLPSNRVFLSSHINRMMGIDEHVAFSTFEAYIKKVHPEDRDLLLKVTSDAIASKNQDSFTIEYRVLLQNNTVKYLLSNGKIKRDDSGKAYYIEGTLQDVSERKETELLLKQLNEKLEKRAIELETSNAELERFAYVASHDLQEPLRMVTSFLQLLEKKYKSKLDDKADQYIHFAVDGANRMKRLILDLLEYSRVGTKKEEAGCTDMNEITAEVLETFKEQIEDLSATVNVAALPVLPYAHRTQMVQLMQNLVGNAIKYHSEKPLHIDITAKEQSNKWIFSVKDNGIGFDKKFSEKVFVIFQRLHNKNEYSGTGVGLSVCKKIIELHGGKIWVNPSPGEGCTFYFSLPKE